MQTLSSPRNRVRSIDLLRGFVMIIMALDHVRIFFHYDVSIGNDPLDLTKTWPALFFTRWITHFCAPVFVFLTGTGIFLYSLKTRSKKKVWAFLFSRGLWLIIAEIFLINFAFTFDLQFSAIVLQVIWAIGICMVCLSFLQFLPVKILLAIGLVIVCCHNLLDNINFSRGWPAYFWSALHKKGFFPVGEDTTLIIMYPFLPWLGLMICGYCIGKLYEPGMSDTFRKKFLLYTGCILTLLFFVIRATDIYGDPNTWTRQETGMFTFMDFLDTTKYPPSLLFMLMTTGPALIFLAVSEGTQGWLARRITTFGKVAFFFYFLHFVVIHIIRWLFFFVSGHSPSELIFGSPAPGNMPTGNGYPLWVVYLVWILVVIVLYFPCRWYARYKASHDQWWLTYI